METFRRSSGARYFNIGSDSYCDASTVLGSLLWLFLANLQIQPPVSPHRPEVDKAKIIPIVFSSATLRSLQGPFLISSIKSSLQACCLLAKPSFYCSAIPLVLDRPSFHLDRTLTFIVLLLAILRGHTNDTTPQPTSIFDRWLPIVFHVLHNPRSSHLVLWSPCLSLASNQQQLPILPFCPTCTTTTAS